MAVHLKILSLSYKALGSILPLTGISISRLSSGKILRLLNISKVKQEVVTQCKNQTESMKIVSESEGTWTLIYIIELGWG